MADCTLFGLACWPSWIYSSSWSSSLAKDGEKLMKGTRQNDGRPNFNGLWGLLNAGFSTTQVLVLSMVLCILEGDIGTGREISMERTTFIAMESVQLISEHCQPDRHCAVSRTHHCPIHLTRTNRVSHRNISHITCSSEARIPSQQSFPVRLARPSP